MRQGADVGASGIGSVRPICSTIIGLLLLGAVFLWAVEPLDAQLKSSLPKPTGEIVLTVTGENFQTNAPGRAEIDWQMLKGLGVRTLKTSTPWTEGTPEFKGVLARDLLDHLAIKGKTARAIALNDYAYDIPLSDLRKYPVLLAYEMNGKPLQVRDKGPIWLVFPLDQFAELRNRITQRKMVWQLVELRIK